MFYCGFQPNAFQNNAFQIITAVTNSSTGAPASGRRHKHRAYEIDIEIIEERRREKIRADLRDIINPKPKEEIVFNSIADAFTDLPEVKKPKHTELILLMLLDG